ncbi:hypothetical protein [Acinetobacter sp. ANC 3813]|uniref:hypothetical protein n=1 Tax=Acinetobacter sp. ANC 3813 TaxID=1977873 RepID=UPI000A359D3C|nr:hypothetical protein [Acinetobacter sp. ANC 3813]OTG87837.1 hypothetical protein B9T34_16000 [Acinetobacter sp. ANC 3813]
MIKDYEAHLLAVYGVTEILWKNQEATIFRNLPNFPKITAEQITAGWVQWQKGTWLDAKVILPAEGEEVLVHRSGQVFQATKAQAYMGGFKERNCWGWQGTGYIDFWMKRNFRLPSELYYTKPSGEPNV